MKGYPYLRYIERHDNELLARSSERTARDVLSRENARSRIYAICVSFSFDNEIKLTTRRVGPESVPPRGDEVRRMPRESREKVFSESIRAGGTDR